MFFLGELKHGVYDDCTDLTDEEINAVYGFDQDGRPFDDEEEDYSDNEISDSELEGSQEGSAQDFIDVNTEEYEEPVDSEDVIMEDDYIDTKAGAACFPIRIIF